MLMSIISCNQLLSVRYLKHLKYFKNAYFTPRSLNFTMLNVKTEIIKRTGVESKYNPLVKSREYLMEYEPNASVLPARNMKDSFTSAIIPLSTDVEVQNKYVNFLGTVRLGRLMEDMDLFAVWVVHQHLKIPNHPPNIPIPYTFVTILVDKIDFTKINATSDSDIRLSGHVSWVGKSSIEVVVWLEQNQEGVLKKLTRALFLIASRNSTNTKAAVINPISPFDEKEKAIIDGGALRKTKRMQLANISVFKSEPNDFEQKLIYDIFKKTSDTHNNMSMNKRLLTDNSIWMQDTRVATLIFPQPEDRNAHNKVFGGYLMRNALELSWANANLYNKQRPRLEHISDIQFRFPVDVSTYIKMESYVIFTQMNYMEIMVIAHVLGSGIRNTTNVFYFTYSAEGTVKEVVPRTYHESMWFLDGRRKFQSSMGLTEPTIDIPLL